MVDVRTVVLRGDYAAFIDLIVPEIQKFMQSSPLIFTPEIIPTSPAYAGGIIGCFEVGINYIIEMLET